MRKPLKSEPATETKRRGKHNATDIQQRRPALYNAIVDCLARGMAVKEVARQFRCSNNSVAVIRRTDQRLIGVYKQQAAGVYKEVAMLAAEEARDRVLNAPESISFQQLMIASAIATDKALLLTGEATERVEHVHRPSDDDFEVMLAKAKQAGKFIDVGTEDNPDKRMETDYKPQDRPANRLPAIGPAADRQAANKGQAEADLHSDDRNHSPPDFGDSLQGAIHKEDATHDEKPAIPE